MATTTKKNPSVQYVRDVNLEERLNKVILLIEAQNKAWQKCLTLLTEMNTLMFEKYKSADLLLEDHPPVRAPAAEPVTVGAARQPQPFNNYSDTLPYGTELEEEREAPPESFPPRTQTNIPESQAEYSQTEPPPEYSQGGLGPEYTQGQPPSEYHEESKSASESAAPNSAESAPQEPRMRIAPGPPVSSKAELLERVEKVS